MIIGEDKTELNLTLDTNVLASTIPLELGGKLVGVYVNPLSGTHDNHKLMLQVSGNGVDFYDTSASLTGCGAMPDQWFSANYVRLKITTPEGSESKVTINIIAK